MLSIITPLLVIAFLIFIHELGHFGAARLVGVHVEEFSVGFPPKILTKTIGKTRYILSLIPLGGYVRLKGQNLEDEDHKDPENYAAKSIGQRFFILVAGPLMNIIFAATVMPIVFMIGFESPSFLQQEAIINNVQPTSFAERVGFSPNDQIVAFNNYSVNSWQTFNQYFFENLHEDTAKVSVLRGQQTKTLTFSPSDFKAQEGFGWEQRIPPIIGKIKNNSAASKADLQTGDLILSLNDKPIKDFREISAHVQKNKNAPLAVKISRNNFISSISVLPEFDSQNKAWLIGFSIPMNQENHGFVESLSLGFNRLLELSTDIFAFLKRLVFGQVSADEVGGPVMIFNAIGDAGERGIESLLLLAGFISFQLAILNLLPIPALDGGHILLLLFEKIKGKPLSPGFRRRSQSIGMVLLLGLMIFVTLKDIWRL